MGLNQEQDMFIDSLYKEMAHLMMQIALANIQEISQAEEAVQDTFRIACRKIDAVMTSPNPKGWLMNTMRYVIKDQQRAKARYHRFLCKLIAIEHEKPLSYETELSVDLIYENLVNSEDFLLLKRLYLQDMSMREIAEEDGITLETCKKRIQRARKRLQKYIDEI